MTFRAIWRPSFVSTASKTVPLSTPAKHADDAIAAQFNERPAAKHRLPERREVDLGFQRIKIRWRAEHWPRVEPGSRSLVFFADCSESKLGRPSELRAKLTDEQLLAAWCEGDENAGDQLLRSVFPRLYRFFFNKVGDDTRELVQQTLLGCVEQRDKLAQCINFDAYLLRMANNKLYDFLRKRARSREQHPGTLPSVQELRTSMASLVGRKQRDTAVLTALRELPVELQTILELHYWNGLSVREMADALEIPEGTVKSRLRRARSVFEKTLGDDAQGGSGDIIGTVKS